MITNVFHKPERHALIGHQQVTRGLVGQNKRFASKESQSHLQREFYAVVPRAYLAVHLYQNPCLHT